ncbi:MAG: hypothetical protein KJO60_12770, partial [Desulfofustis sp.]|nr:hypothetical protein [Desulfofustis sp.]
ILARLNEKGVFASIEGSTILSMRKGRARNPISAIMIEISRKSVNFFSNDPAIVGCIFVLLLLRLP